MQMMKGKASKKGGKGYQWESSMRLEVMSDKS